MLEVPDVFWAQECLYPPMLASLYLHSAPFYPFWSNGRSFLTIIWLQFVRESLSGWKPLEIFPSRHSALLSHPLLLYSFRPTEVIDFILPASHCKHSLQLLPAFTPSLIAKDFFPRPVHILITFSSSGLENYSQNFPRLSLKPLYTPYSTIFICTILGIVPKIIFL